MNRPRTPPTDPPYAMIAVVDYRAGNLTSVVAALASIDATASVTSNPADVAAADRVIFPGVGAAAAAMRNLRELNLEAALRQALADGKPFLGICLGYQVLFEHSDEDGGVDCLGLLPGRVVRFSDAMLDPDSRRPLKVPQMGWNQVRFQGRHPLWNNLDAESEFYFVHSYHPVPDGADVAAVTDYGITFASGVVRANLAAFQFHPEKSGRPGLRLLRNFCRWTP